MSGDYSRLTFDPQRNFAGVLMQQGRVQLDADWNELVAQIGRRAQTGALDTLGRVAVARETPNAFHITPDGANGTFSIGRGRLYVDGLVAENHGAGSAEWNPQLAEERGTTDVDYFQQPYYPNPLRLLSGVPLLVYLDVWQREITAFEEPSLVEAAVGVDTTTRLQTIWQVKVLADVGAITCSTPDKDVRGWLAETAASAGRLTTGTIPTAPDSNPCASQPGSGYRGPENHLYRVEIHDTGRLGQATFKWSRDNGTVATRASIVNLSQIKIESVGRDSELRFNDGDWIEIVDEARELHNQPGVVRRIAPLNGVDDAARTIALQSPLLASDFPANPVNLRIRRWDQSGQIRSADGAAITDLDAAGSPGVITTPADGKPVILEHGIIVTFGATAADGRLRAGDYWVFTARAGDGTVESLTAAPPRGIHHHYCRLALVTFPNGPFTQCLDALTPAADSTGHGCGCTVCISAEEQQANPSALQLAVDQVNKLGGTVCLGVGQYQLPAPLHLPGANSVRLTGQGWATILSVNAAGPAVVVEDATNVTIERMSIVATQAEAVVLLRNCAGIAVTDCIVGVTINTGHAAHSAAIGLQGYQLGVNLSRNLLNAPRGVVSLTGKKEDRQAYLLTAGLAVSDNAMRCSDAGVRAVGQAFHYAETRITGNYIVGGTEAGILMAGAVLSKSCLNISGNTLDVAGTGVMVATDATRVNDNDIIGRSHREAEGILVADGPGGVIEGLQVTGNRISGFNGSGILLSASIASGTIKQNAITRTESGIVMDGGASAKHLVIENNQLSQIALASNDPDTSAAGIRVLGARIVEVVANVVTDVGREAVQSKITRTGIQAVGCGVVRISGNRIVGIGPTQAFLGPSTGIEVLPPFLDVEISDNVVQRTAGGKPGLGEWSALVVAAPTSGLLQVGKQTHYAIAKNHVAIIGRGKVTTVPKSIGQLSVRGNRFGAVATRQPIVLIESAGPCLVAENQCTLGIEPHMTAAPVLDLRGPAFTVTTNQLRGARGGIALSIASTIVDRQVVLGNSVLGLIVLNGHLPLPPPWRALNIMQS
jgi:hypothetical protein